VSFAIGQRVEQPRRRLGLVDHHRTSAGAFHRDRSPRRITTPT
jgi:hypothetical protein